MAVDSGAARQQRHCDKRFGVLQLLRVFRIDRRRSLFDDSVPLTERNFRSVRNSDARGVVKIFAAPISFSIERAREVSKITFRFVILSFGGKSCRPPRDWWEQTSCHPNLSARRNDRRRFSRRGVPRRSPHPPPANPCGWGRTSDDVDDAGRGLRTVQHGASAPCDFNSVYHLERDLTQIHAPVEIVIERATVQQNEHIGGAREAAHFHQRRCSAIAGLFDFQGRASAQRFGDGHVVVRAKIILRENLHVQRQWRGFSGSDKRQTGEQK